MANMLARHILGRRRSRIDRRLNMPRGSQFRYCSGLEYEARARSECNFIQDRCFMKYMRIMKRRNKCYHRMIRGYERIHTRKLWGPAM